MKSIHEEKSFGNTSSHLWRKPEEPFQEMPTLNWHGGGCTLFLQWKGTGQDGGWTEGHKGGGLPMHRAFGKRAADLLLSACGLIMLLPLFLLLAMAIVIDDPGPAFFVQKRVGRRKNGELTYFMMYKFRSMKLTTPHDMPTHLLVNPEQYITRVGRVMRKTSLDELPQIWNILKGDMSIIGPRPALWNQEDLVAEREKYGANDVLPGLSGWAQVNGRDELDIDVKAKLDGEYAGNVTLATDLNCIYRTLANVLKGLGVVEGGTGTMAKQREGNVHL